MGQHASGGAATAGGISFQSRVVAYYSVRILGEADCTPPLGLSANVTLEHVRCETGEPTDDLLVGTSENGHIFGQAKRTLDLSKLPDSEVASVVSQFVRQYLANRQTSVGERPWNAELDPARDRLALIVGPRASSSIHTALADVLNACRGLQPSQPLQDAATNEAQKSALTIFLAHARSAWLQKTGEEPDAIELRRFTSLCHVVVLAIEEDGSDEVAANDRLRSVLSEPSQSRLAWDCLIRQALDLAKRRTGIGRSGLQQLLLGNAIPLQVPRSYKADVVALKAFTNRSNQLLTPLSEITLSKRSVHLGRLSSQKLWEKAERESLLVIGEPGAGKSGAMNDLCRTAERLGRDLVVVLVDRIAARTSRSFSTELGLEHDLVDILAAWPGTETGFVVFDALDAARDEQTATMVRDVITRVVGANTRWHIVASIRKFDLRHSRTLRPLFPGTGADGHADKDFGAISHLDVPILSDDELSWLGSQDVALQAILTSATPPLLRLLRVPFNLRLVAELLSEGASTAELTPIETQLDLLESYWAHRVVEEDRHGDDREAVLRQVCEQLAERRVLYADRSAVRASGEHIERLLSQNVLTEWRPTPNSPPDRYRLSFSHHVLFDYAVSRLLLRGNRESLSLRLKESADFVFVARPSIEFHLRYLWEHVRDEFWAVTLGMLGDAKIPQIAALIGPAVVVARAKVLNDLGPLLTALRSASPNDQVAGHQFLRHLVGATLVGNTVVMGAGAGPWCELAADLSSTLTPNTAGPFRVLLARVLETTKTVTLTVPQLIATNTAARALLAYSWQQAQDDRAAAIVGIQLSCRTIAGGHTDTARVVREVLQEEHLKSRGHLELPWVAREIGVIYAVDPELAADVYIGAFSFHETSSEQTPIGSSQILSFVSHKQQDYEGAWWQLGEIYREFLEAQPAAAIRALAAVVEAYVDHDQRHYGRQEHLNETFALRGRTATLRVDHSAVWDQGTARQHDAPIKMLDTLYAWLSAEDSTNESCERGLDALVTFARSAVFWKRLLAIATDLTPNLLHLAAELCARHPILLGQDTSVSAGDFLKVRFKDLPAEQRATIEKAVLSMPDEAPTEMHGIAERARARLLGCLSEDLLAPATRQLLAELRSTGNVPENLPSFRLGGFSSSPYDTEAHWRDLDVPMDDPLNRELLELIEPVADFTTRFLNSAPAEQDAARVIEHLNALHSSLADRKPGRHASAVDSGWGHLASACKRIVEAGSFNCADSNAACICDLLLESSTKRQPVFDQQQEEAFDKSPSWGSPAARIEAAAGLMTIIQCDNCSSKDVSEAVERLSRDDVSSVRFQIVSRLFNLFRSNPEFVWRLAERAAQEESNQSVVLALLIPVLRALARMAPDRVIGSVEHLLERLKDKGKVQETGLSLVVDLHVYHEHQASRAIVDRILEGIVARPDLARHLLPSRGALTFGPNEPGAAGIRNRAFQLMTELLDRAQASFDQIATARIQGASTPEEDKTLGELGALINDVCKETYFASGAFDLKTAVEQKVSEDVRLRFYSEASSLLDKLVSVRVPAGIHDVVQMLESYIDHASEDVFLRVATAVRKSSASGYQSESLAETLIVRIIQRYLADHRAMLRDNSACRTALFDVLEVFVGAGSPSARELTFGLSEIFR
jgi:hypothetical protein